MPKERSCQCGSALATAILTDPGAIPEDTRKKLGIFVEKYLV
jgi:5'-methylthioadenosine phosphorylase